MPQVRPIADIKSNLLRPATTSLFEVFIPMDAVSETALKQAGIFLNKNKEWQLNLLCTEATLPGSQLQTMEVLNDFSKASKKSYNGVNCSSTFQQGVNLLSTIGLYVPGAILDDVESLCLSITKTCLPFNLS